MSTETTLAVALVAPSVWQPRQEEAFATLDDRHTRFSQAVLASMHNRHVGATPALIAALVPALLSPAVRLADNNPWLAVFARLMGDLQPNSSDGYQSGRRNRRYGMVLHANPMYCISRIAMPLIERACRHLGRCFLFCEDALDTSIDAVQYKTYSRDLELELLELARTPGEDLFWQERAVTLAAFSRRFAHHSGGALLPEIDPTALAMMLRTRGGPLKVTARSKRHHQMSASHHHRDKRHKREGGIDGIQLTRRLEDLDDILLSEYINPDVIREDRLLNTGFFAVQRRPRREKVRDVLLAALLPVAADFRLEADFIKSCWFELCANLAFLLRRQRMLHSEFRWCEGGPDGNGRGGAFLLKDLALMDHLSDLATPTAFRKEFLTALGWLPSFLDRRDPPAPLSTTAVPLPSRRLPAEKQYRALAAWASNAWSAQREHDRWQEGQPTASKRLAYDRFSVVHLMLFLPARAKPQKSFSLADLGGRLGLGRQAGQNLSVTWVPERLHAGSGWRFDARGKAGLNLFSPSEERLEGSRIVERLVSTWLDQLTREIWHA